MTSQIRSQSCHLIPDKTIAVPYLAETRTADQTLVKDLIDPCSGLNLISVTGRWVVRREEFDS